MKLIKPPKKKRLIASWRAYYRWWQYREGAIYIKAVARDDGESDCYICNDYLNMKQYVGSFRTISASN